MRVCQWQTLIALLLKLPVYLYSAMLFILFGMSVLSMTPLNLSAPAPIAKSGTKAAEWLPLAHDMADSCDTISEA